MIANGVVVDVGLYFGFLNEPVAELVRPARPVGAMRFRGRAEPSIVER